MMVYVNECYVRAQQAVFVEPVIEAMRKVSGYVFTCKEDFNMFVRGLEEKLEKVKPSTSIAYVALVPSGENRGKVYLLSDGRHPVLAELTYVEVKGMLEYDQTTGTYWVLQPMRNIKEEEVKL